MKSVVIDAQYQLYPNPLTSKNEITVTLDEPATAVVKLLSVSGSEIKVNKTSVGASAVKLVPTTVLKSGLYIITVEERGATRNYRLLVE